MDTMKECKGHPRVARFLYAPARDGAWQGRSDRSWRQRKAAKQ